MKVVYRNASFVRVNLREKPSKGEVASPFPRLSFILDLRNEVRSKKASRSLTLSREQEHLIRSAALIKCLFLNPAIINSHFLSKIGFYI